MAQARGEQAAGHVGKAGIAGGGQGRIDDVERLGRGRARDALGGKGRLDCDTAFRSRSYDLCGRCACELAEEVERHPNDWELKVEEAR